MDIKANLNLTSDGQNVRRMTEWQAAKRAAHASGSAQDFVRDHARQNGIAVILWNDGHTTMYVSDGSDCQRIRLGKAAA